MEPCNYCGEQVVPFMHKGDLYTHICKNCAKPNEAEQTTATVD